MILLTYLKRISLNVKQFYVGKVEFIVLDSSNILVWYFNNIVVEAMNRKGCYCALLTIANMHHNGNLVPSFYLNLV